MINQEGKLSFLQHTIKEGMDGANGVPSTYRAIREEILHRAQILWEQRSRPMGEELTIWLEAENQILNGIRTPLEEGCINVLILAPDRFSAKGIETVVSEVCPGSKRRTTTQLAIANQIVATWPVDLFIAYLYVSDGATIDLLFSAASGSQQPLPRTLILTNCAEVHALILLRRLHITGVFDPVSEGGDAFLFALRAVLKNETYWSQTLLKGLTSPSAGRDVASFLTPREKLGLAFIGTGDDDEESAVRIGLKPGTVRSIRRDLHRKLGVHHKGQLVQLAAMLGFVRFSANGIVVPGLEMLKSLLRQSKGSTVSVTAST